MKNMSYGIIGGGTMGTTFGKALIKNGLAKPNQITFGEIQKDKWETLQKETGSPVTDVIQDVANSSTIIFMAVKPQDFPEVGKNLHDLLTPEKLVISIMAGTSIQNLREHLGHNAVIRAMPNTPAQIGHGITVWTASDEVNKSQKDHVRTLLETLGKEIYVEDERQIDLATAVSGSGPGFVFLLLEALIDGSVQIGLPRSLASKLVYQTVFGSALYALESDLHTSALRDMVTSPGGTTAAGLHAMEEAGVRAGTINAIIAAYRRTQELNRQT